MAYNLVGRKFCSLVEVHEMSWDMLVFWNDLHELMYKEEKKAEKKGKRAAKK